MNFLDSISSALFSGLGGGGAGNSDFLSPITSMLEPAGIKDAPKMGAVSQAGGPMSMLGLLGSMAGGGGGGLSSGLFGLLGGALMDGLGSSSGDMMKLGGPTPAEQPPGDGGAAPGGMFPGLSDAASKIDLMAGLPPASGGGATRSMEPMAGSMPDTGADPYAQSAADPKKFLGMTGNDWRDVLQSVFQGAAGVDPSSPGLSAFAQGGAGTFNAFNKQAAARSAAETAAEDRSWKREDRTIAADDRQYKRGREGAKDAREARTSEVALVKTLSDVMRNMDPQLDTKDRIAVERLVRDEGKRLMDAEALSGEELKTAMETYRKDLEGRLKQQNPHVGGGAPGATAGNGKSQSAPARPASRQAFDALPSGAWFVNPADGRVMQKK